MMEAEPKQTETPLEEAVDELRAAAQAATVAPRIARLRAHRLQIFFGASLFTFFLLAVAAHLDNYFNWDLAISRAVQSISLPGFGTLMRIISIPGNNFVRAVVLVAVAFFVLFVLRYRLEAYALALSAGGGQLLDDLLKWIVGRPRPTAALVHVLVQEKSLSFPSGHVMHYVVFYGFLFFLAYTLLRRSLLRALLLVIWGGLVLLVGLSRIYLGAHWPSDVAAAYLGGGTWLIFIIHRYRQWNRDQGSGIRDQSSNPPLTPDS